MRERKYRAFNKENGMMYNLESVTLEELRKGVISLDGENYIPCVYMDYIGKKDKNGKEIYEGDIVKLGDWKPKVIEYGNNGFFGFGLKDTELFLSKYDMARIEVIGNKFENPELLEETK